MGLLTAVVDEGLGDGDSDVGGEEITDGATVACGEVSAGRDPKISDLVRSMAPGSAIAGSKNNATAAPSAAIRLSLKLSSTQRGLIAPIAISIGEATNSTSNAKTNSSIASIARGRMAMMASNAIASKMRILNGIRC